MQYMGGKAGVARRIVQAILSDTDNRSNWFEPFVGGGNVLEHAAPHFDSSTAMDAHQDLIMMWSAVRDGWRPSERVSRERYETLRHAEPSPERGYVGFGTSFGGKWFGGFSGDHDRSGTRDPLSVVSARTVCRQGSVFEAAGVTFQQALFGDVAPDPGSVVYCDPPYAGTTGYSTGAFDHESFWKTLEAWSESCDVYVSEYTGPESVSVATVWSHEKRNVLKSSDNRASGSEKLFKVRPVGCTPGLGPVQSSL